MAGNSTIRCVCRTVLPHEGPLPKRWGLLEVSSPDVVVSSLKPSRDGDVALRVYEASGRAAAGVTIKLSAKILAAREANLMEDAGAEIKSRRRFGAVRSASVRDQDDPAAAGCEL